MFTRVVGCQANSGAGGAVVNKVQEHLLPILQRQPDFVDIVVLSDKNQSRGVGMHEFLELARRRRDIPPPEVKGFRLPFAPPLPFRPKTTKLGESEKPITTIPAETMDACLCRRSDLRWIADYKGLGFVRRLA